MYIRNNHHQLLILKFQCLLQINNHSREESQLEPLTKDVINRDTDLSIKIFTNNFEDYAINIAKKLKNIGITE